MEKYRVRYLDMVMVHGWKTHRVGVTSHTPGRRIYEGKAIPSVRKSFEWRGRSEWMALPNGKLCHVFTQPRKRRTECRRIWLDFDGFEWIWMDLIDYIETKMIPKLTI